MRNRFIAGITLLSFLGGAALPVVALSSEKASEGRVATSSGEVLRKAGDTGWEMVQPSAISAGDLLRTGPDGQAIVQIGNSHLRMAANTELRVVSLDQQNGRVTLERGRVLGNVADRLTVSTAKTATSVSQGEFVLETTRQGSALRVMSGNATLAALDNSSVQAPMVSTPSGAVDQKVLSGVDSLSSIQSQGDIALLGEWKRKGKGSEVRQSDTDETVGGEGDASPDQDVPPVRRPQPPVVQDVPPPVEPVTPVTPTTPPVTPPSTPPPAVATGGSSLFPVLGGLAVLGGLIALVASNSGDNDNDNVFIPNNPGVPSPSLP